MAETTAPRPDGQPGTGSGDASDESLGELVSLAIRDISQLVKWEIDLAKIELRDDIRRLGISGAAIGAASIIGCMVPILGSFAAAFGISSAGIPLAWSFAIVAFAYAVLALTALLIGRQWLSRLAGLRRTRTTVSENLALLRNGERREGES
jgi:VIT1/CCC1 family predicted Fe2+/Mn2+ transporter